MTDEAVPPKPTALEQLNEARRQAKDDVVQASQKLTEADSRRTEAKQALRTAIEVAGQTGVEKQALASITGYSASTIGAWIRGDKTPEDEAEAEDVRLAVDPTRVTPAPAKAEDQGDGDAAEGSADDIFAGLEPPSED